MQCLFVWGCVLSQRIQHIRTLPDLEQRIRTLPDLEQFKN